MSDRFVTALANPNYASPSPPRRVLHHAVAQQAAPRLNRKTTLPASNRWPQGARWINAQAAISLQGVPALVRSPVAIDGAEDVVTVLVHKDPKTQRFYLHSVTTKEYLLGHKQSISPATGQQRTLGAVRTGGVESILHDAMTFKVGISKVVDANGAPLAPAPTATKLPGMATGSRHSRRSAGGRSLGFSEKAPVADVAHAPRAVAPLRCRNHASRRDCPPSCRRNRVF